MNQIAAILPVEQIQLNVVATSKKRAFEQAGLLFENRLGIARDKIFDSLLARERLGSTGLGLQVAVPHGRIKGLKKASAALMRVQDPLPFESPDGQPVKLMIFLLVPESANQAHLDILSELAQMLSDKAVRERLCESDNPTDVHRIIAQWAPFQS
jgi:PTS system nitrogen regulatory IIA component